LLPAVREDQRRKRRVRQLAVRRRRRGAFVGAAVLLLLLAGVVRGLSGRGEARPTRGRETRTDAGSTAKRLSPPGPIPGYLLIADRGNNRMLLVDGARHIFWTYPRGHSSAMPLRFDDDTFFGPRADRIISNQEDQHTIQIISIPGGRVLWRYGHVNRSGSAPGYLNTPDDAYLLPNGLVSVADAYNCRVIFLSPSHRIVRQFGEGPGSCRHDPPRSLGDVNGATPLADGSTLVSEINGSWIDDIRADGRVAWTVQAPLAYPSDPQELAPDRILVADYTRPGAAIIMNRRGRVLWRYGPPSGPGMLDHPSLATRIAPGLIAINDDYRQRVVLVSIRSRRIVWQYGHTDVAGRAPGYLNTPDGLDLLSTARAQASPALRRLLSTRPSPPTAPRGTSEPLVVAPAGFRLPAPVQREVGSVAGGRVILAGGLDAGGQSTGGVFRLDPQNGRLTQLGAVPQPFHDAAGAMLGHRLVVFGGGAARSSGAIQAFDLRTRRGAVIGQLPHALSDLASAQNATSVYLVGGYDGIRPRPEIYRTTDGVHLHVVGRLPTGLRYPAVALDGSALVVAGGISNTGPSSAVYAFDTASGRSRMLGRLPRATAHAMALDLAGAVYVVGGTPRIAARIDPATGSITAVVAHLPLSDSAAVTIAADHGLLLGGTIAGAATTGVYTLSAVSARR
jgi:hypothetical protein